MRAGRMARSFDSDVCPSETGYCCAHKMLWKNIRQVRGWRASPRPPAPLPSPHHGSNRLLLSLQRDALILELKLELFLDCAPVVFCGAPHLLRHQTLQVAQLPLSIL